MAKPLRLVDRSIDPVLARPILRSYLAITLDLAFIQSLVASHKVGARGHIFVVDDTGQVLFDPVADRRGRRLRSDLFDDLRVAAENEALLATSDRGQDAVFRAETLEPGLLLVGELPESDILAASRRLSTTVAGIIAGTIAITAFLTIFVLKRLLVRPILELGRAAGEIGAGNLRAQARIETRDEFGQLAHAFSEMGPISIKPKRNCTSDPMSCRAPRRVPRPPASPNRNSWPT